jgi:hypothetical protein
MDAAIVVAVIALIGAIGNVALTYFLNARSERRRALQRSDAAWARHCESIAFAADELSDRIDNILKRDLLDAYADTPHKDEVILSTLFRFSQYFGWSEILRRELRSLNPRYATAARRLEELQARVGVTFATDRYGAGPFMIWRESQRAVGELMIVNDREVIDTLGVADFLAEFEKFRPWLSRMERLMKAERPEEWSKSERERLDDVHTALDALVSELRPAVSPAASTSRRHR